MKSTIEEARSDSVGPTDLSTASDEQLLLNYRQRGDRQAFGRLVQRYERELFSYLRRYLGDAEMAEDAFQQTFLQVHLKCDRFDTDRKFRPWLYTIATNQAIDSQRRNKRHRIVSLDRRGNQAGEADTGALIDLLVANEPEPMARLESEERRQWIRGSVDQLPEALRAAIGLVYYQGFKYREAADILGIPVGTIKSRLHAAVLKLNQAWSETHPNESD